MATVGIKWLMAAAFGEFHMFTVIASGTNTVPNHSC